MIDFLLSPGWLVNQIPAISVLISAILLIMFSDVVNRKIVFPLADFVKNKTVRSVKKQIIAKYLSEFLATLVFVLYVLFGSVFVSRFIVQPILQNAKSILVLIIILLYIGLSYIINRRKWRSQFFKV